MKLNRDEVNSPEESHVPSPPNNKFKRESTKAKPSDKLRFEDEQPTISASASGKRKPKKRGVPPNPVIVDKDQARVDKYGKKLSAARDRLAKQKPSGSPGFIRNLSGTAVLEARARVHGKVSEAEQENVGVEAAHRSELAGERAGQKITGAVKGRIRSRPERQVRTLQKKHTAAESKLRFNQLTKQHPGLQKKAVRKMAQKQMHKKQFQKNAQAAAQKAATTTTAKVLLVVKRIARAVLNLVKAIPKTVWLILLCVLLLFVVVQSCVGMAGMIGNTIGGAIAASTYPSETDEMLAAEAAYDAKEADLQYLLDNYAELNPGYDEYIFYLDEIWHDPYVLISILSSLYRGPWTLEEVQDTLTIFFDMQYALTETVEIEIRYRTEIVTYTDPETGEELAEEIEVPYDYVICTVTLVNVGLENVASAVLNAEQMAFYTLYMATLGNRPDLFPIEEYPYASTYE